MPTASPTIFRRDLVVSRQETPEGVQVVLKDPGTGRFFRLRELDYFIAQRLDGSTTLDVVAQEVEGKFGVRPAAAVLDKFVESLRRLGLLEEEARDGPRRVSRDAKPHGGMFRGNLLYLRLKAFNPDRLLNRLVGHLWFCFSPWFLIASAMLIILAAAIAVTNWDDIMRDLSDLYRIEMVLVAWLIIFAVNAAHEFGHGLACKHFGGEVREMGFLLIYFEPAFYCNVSDAWLFPEKAKRLWVSIAGPYVELLLWALAAVTWRVTEPTTALNTMALIVVVTSGVKLFLNFMPLIKLDGYYLLSDYLAIPNLRKRAFAYLRYCVHRVWASSPRKGPAVTPRERRIYLTYGILAGAYSLFLLGYVGLIVGNFLIEHYHGTGALVYAGLVFLVFQRPIRKAFAKTSAAITRSRFQISSLRRPAKMFLVLLVVLAALFVFRLDLKVGGEFKVLPIQNIEVRAAVDGIIEEIYVDEGSRVDKGARIARLSDRDYTAELRKIEAEISEKQAKLRLLQAGARPEEVAVARDTLATAQTRLEQARNRYAEAQRMHSEQVTRLSASVDKAKERLSYAQRFLDMFKELSNKELVALKQVLEAEEAVAIRTKELQEAQAELKMAQANDLTELLKALAVAEKEENEAQARLTLLLAGSRIEEIDAAKAEITRLEAQRRYRLEQLELGSVTSPFAGVVTTPRPRERIGQHMKKGDLIVEVQQLTTITAEIAVSEKEIADVMVGQQVVLKARAFPEETFTGTVTSIAPAALKEEQPGRPKVVRVMTETDNRTFRLKPEMTGNAKISCGPRRILDLLTRRVARYVRVEFWSWW